MSDKHSAQLSKLSVHSSQFAFNDQSDRKIRRNVVLIMFAQWAVQ